MRVQESEPILTCPKAHLLLLCCMAASCGMCAATRRDGMHTVLDMSCSCRIETGRQQQQVHIVSTASAEQCQGNRLQHHVSKHTAYCPWHVCDHQAQ